MRKTDHEFKQVLAEIQELRREVRCGFEGLAKYFKREIDKMATDFQAAFAELSTQATANTDAEAAAGVVLNGIAARLDAAAGDPVATRALAAQLKASADSLSAAIVAGTPAA